MKEAGEITMLVPLRGSWALILGVSSGMGRATARALAAEGVNVLGVYFDRDEGEKMAEELAGELREQGVEAHFFNRNAASSSTREEVTETAARLTGPAGLRITLHSLAFGTLLPYLGEPGAETVAPRQMAMTVDVMAHSLVYWTQALHSARLLRPGAKIYALTSSGTSRIMPSYGAVSAAKCALESHVRQLAVELAPAGVAINALRAGITMTPALELIPGGPALAELARTRNPHRRITVPEDVGEAVLGLSLSDSSWLTGNVIGVDGGELVSI
ncbi:SDR family oxidoreductase [Micromonospora sp. NPDC048905]|uniref:SDR family oxidoreductase n=1 Tax=unclassified Micromonospora TaxID=2617518 RepID=UPI0033F6F40C